MKKISRRQFLYGSAAVLSTTVPSGNFWPLAAKTCQAALSDDVRGKVFKGDGPKELWKWSHEGFLYRKLNNRKVVCGICPNRCVLAPGDRSVCRSKVNIDGTLYSLTYGNPCSVNTDPIEKKPLFHFKPRTKAFRWQPPAVIFDASIVKIMKSPKPNPMRYGIMSYSRPMPSGRRNEPAQIPSPIPIPNRSLFLNT